MDPTYAFSANLFKWEPTRPNLAGPSSNRLLEMVATPLQPPQLQPPPLPATPPPTMTPAVPFGLRPPPPNCSRDQLGGLEELFQAYGIRYYTAAKIAELGFTVNTLLNMKDEELNDMMNSLCQIFRWELLVGERYGIKSAIRAERRRLEEEMEEARRRQHHHMFSAGGSGDGNISAHTALDAFSQEGLSDEPVQQLDQTKDVVGSGTGSGEVGGTWEMVAAANQERNKCRRQRVHEQQRQIRNSSNNKKKDRYNNVQEEGNYEDDDDDDDYIFMDQDDGSLLVGSGGGGAERQREHPFIVTEPGEVARGKKNGLDYLFHLYELCREFLIQVQNIAKERGEKCPTKVTNQVFRYAKKAGATYINKPKMRHYVHCYALHCLDEETSNVLRRAFKERRENVGAWRQACYKPLVAIAASQGWDIDAVFNAHPRLSIWYVPTKLRQLCHAERSSVAAAAAPSSSVSGGGGGGGVDHLPF